MARTSANSAARTKARATATTKARAAAYAAIAARRAASGLSTASTYRLKPVAVRVGVGLRRGFFRHRHLALVRKRLTLRRGLHTKYPHRKRRKGIRL